MRWRTILFVAFVSCSMESLLEYLSPGALYILHSGDYEGIEWLDPKKPKPTPGEVEQAGQACQDYFRQLGQEEEQNKQVLQDPNATADDRLNAVSHILYHN